MAATTQAQATITSPTKAEAETPRRRREGEATGVASMAFESLLDSTRTLIRAETNLAQRISPAQMFEPPMTEGSEHRTSSVEDRQRSDRSKGQHEVENAPTGVTARRSAHARAQTELGSPAHGSRMTVHRPADGEATSIQSNASPPPNNPSDLGAERRTVSSPNSDGSNLRNVAPPQTGPTGLAITGASMVESRATSTSNVAQQVGELLNANRGAADSGQPVSSSSAAGDPRSNGTAPKTAAPASSRTAQADPSSRRSEDTATKEVSPFERLVRSIRLQSGSRSSSARLQLHPPELGRLRVDVRLVGEQVEIDVRTETEAARGLVSRRADELKTSLEQHGIHVRRLDVTLHLFPELDPGSVGYDATTVGPDAQRNSSWTGGRRRSGEGRMDDAGVVATGADAPTTAAIAEARLDIRV